MGASRKPAQPAVLVADPIPQRIRGVREAAGIRLQDLARRVGLATSHFHYIEKGKVAPTEEVAARLARELGEDESLYRVWARSRQRMDVPTLLRAAPVLAEYFKRWGDLLRDPRQAVRLPATEVAALEHALIAGPARAVTLGAPAIADAATTPAEAGAIAGPRPARVLLPVIAVGRDPDLPSSRAGTLRIAPEDFRELEALERPFAVPITTANARRMPQLLPPRGHAIFTRRVLPLEAGAIHAVRLGDGLAFARVLWNGRDLLVLPAPGGQDFETFAAPDEAALRRHVPGRAVLVHREP